MHTPGPWEVNNKRVIAQVGNKSTALGVGVAIEIGIPPEQVQANEKLIAAAPDMLEALESMWQFASVLVEKHAMNGDDTMTDAEHKQWQDAAGQASSAITKARNT